MEDALNFYLEHNFTKCMNLCKLNFWLKQGTVWNKK